MKIREARHQYQTKALSGILGVYIKKNPMLCPPVSVRISFSPLKESKCHDTDVYTLEGVLYLLCYISEVNIVALNPSDQFTAIQSSVVFDIYHLFYDHSSKSHQ